MMSAALEELLDALVAERFTYLPENNPRPIPRAPTGEGRLWVATREACPRRVRCLACNSLVPEAETCPTCHRQRTIAKRRENLRRNSA